MVCCTLLASVHSGKWYFRTFQPLTKLYRNSRAQLPQLSQYHCTPEIPLPLLQVLYRQNWDAAARTLETNRTSVELQVSPGEEGEHLVQIQALTEGGAGAGSGPLRIPKMSSRCQACNQSQSVNSERHSERANIPIPLLFNDNNNLIELFINCFFNVPS